MSDAEQDQKSEGQQSEGQVSDAESLQGEALPIAPDQSTAGMPDGESGRPDEGPQGPNAIPDHKDEPPASGPLAEG